MAYTYPAPPATVTQGGTAVETHQFLRTPTLISRRLQTLLAQKYIADFLLPARFQAVGGAILYETGESIFPDDDPEAIAPLGDYPKTVMSAGELAAAKTVKWGRDTEVSDESIARMQMNPVERALTKLANGNVRYVDSVALGVIASKLTQTYTGSGWTSAEAIIDDVLGAKAKVEEDNVGEGFDLSVVVLKPTQYAKVMAKLIVDGLLPREAANPLNSGQFPNYLGLTWTTTTHSPVSDPLLVDNMQLGGMADEDLQSPGYTRSRGGVGVEVKSIRDDDIDGWKLRARRVTVPVVLEGRAGVRITGTGV
ncbi:hypothetical protein [Tersicoccus sp. Bi-70]|uniref:phage major capsid protein n=1 Tax=Tersicoccus sp. Bi-70 TaxID=1897634 RepID=UPI0009788A71|nr:hypothetical protein [Tersicoccus sp. Bi-70]OMH30647.1 hypothetical protein BGP79_11860 [Tersicoccus sp. Bi-70]